MKADDSVKDDKSGKDPPDKAAEVKKGESEGVERNQLVNNEEQKLKEVAKEKAENSAEKENGKVDEGEAKQPAKESGDAKQPLAVEGDTHKREEKLLNALEEQRKEQEAVLKEQKAILQELKDHKEKEHKEEHEVRPSAGSQL